MASDPESNFLNVYSQNRRGASNEIIASSWLATWLAEQAKSELGPMTPTNLYDRLCSAARSEWKTTKEWPGNARSLSDKIRRFAPNLKAYGVEVIFSRTNTERTIELKMGDAPVTQG